MTVLNLFRGQVIGPSVDIVGDDMLLTLDCEDYNRLPPIINVGAPTGFTLLPQDDGTAIAIDPRGGNTGVAQAFKTFANGGYWPNDSPTLDLVTGILAPEVPGLPVIDQMTALTDLKSFVDSQAPRVSGRLRWWLAPPVTGDGLILYWANMLAPGFIIGNGLDGNFDQKIAQQYIMLFPVPTALLYAPYEIDNDTPDPSAGRLLPIHLGPISWDWARIRGSVYVRGGTPPPEGSGYATGLGSAPTGDAYVDAPGSITDADKTEIGVWHQNRNFVELLTGSAKMPGSEFETTFSGWRVGQVVTITSSRHSRFDRHELDGRRAVIQKVTGKLVTPAGGLQIAFDGVPLTKPFEWRTLTFESILGSAGKATVVIHLMSDTDILTLGPNCDIWITLDDTDPADIEWDLDFGDIAAGTLSMELEKAQEKPPPPVVYRFLVTVDDPGMPDGGTSAVSAQLATAGGAAVELGGVPMEWVLLQWEDNAETQPGTVYALTELVDTTDSGGRVFNVLTRTGTPTAEYHFHVEGLALPID